MGSEDAETSGVAERTSKLPEEIIGTQEARADLLKWKLLLVAGLGAAGLGLAEKAESAPLLLGLIPFVCLYVDLLCANLNIRQIVIGSYYANYRQDTYERFVRRIREVFLLEDWALYWSTVFLSLLILARGVALLLQVSDAASSQPQPSTAPAVAAPETMPATRAAATGHAGGVDFSSPWTQGVILGLSGASGIAFSFFFLCQFRHRLKLVSSILEERRTHKPRLSTFRRAAYTQAELQALYGFLLQEGTFAFPSLNTGLFRAATSAARDDVSGYQYVWVRDNVHIAYAHYVCGYSTAAARCATALLAHFNSSRTRERFREIIADGTIANDAMRRPHIRFDGDTLAELQQVWPHAQNDALGYFLWLYCRLASDGVVACGPEQLACLVQFPRYFSAIQFWKDADSGHWEEARKVSASSIGTVLAGLRELQSLLESRGLWSDPAVAGQQITKESLATLCKDGWSALGRILPCESIDLQPLFRRYDAALLFLIHPLGLLSPSDAHARTIVADVAAHLQGEHGIRRYLGDSYWCADYKEKLSPESRTADHSVTLEQRDALLHVGEEAQWCLFDPIVSIIHGQACHSLLQAGRRDEARQALQLQTQYFNRALNQLTGTEAGVPALRCPEAYYLHHGKYVPNDQVPLLWAQANLWMAMERLQKNITLVG